MPTLDDIQTKVPSDILIFTFNWTTWLAGNTISTSAWAVESGITIDAETNTTTKAAVTLSGGTDGVTYTITDTIVASNGEKKSKHFQIKVETAVNIP